MSDLRGKNALVLGLGLNQGGVGVARYLVGEGANVLVTDMQPASRLVESLVALVDLPIRYTLGEHDEADFDWAEIVVRNPGVPRESRWLQRARERDVRIEMEMTLFFRASPAPIIGVTGTKGKTTTATMVATLLREHWPAVQVAGNMGRSAVLELDSLDPDVPVILELSSFQIEGLIEQQLSPHIAVITNISEDHLDRYPTFDVYAQVKADLARHQTSSDWILFNRDDALLSELVRGLPGQRASFGLEETSELNAFWIEDGTFAGRLEGETFDLGDVNRLQMPGQHAQLNALAAIASATLAGVPKAVIERAIPRIQPIADRMEAVATIAGIEFINDTTATVPVAAIAALRACAGQSIVAIAGGSEKQISMEQFAEELAERAKAVVLLDGDATPGLQRHLNATGFDAIHGPCGSMSEAVRLAAGLASEGDVVLLSPGCASFGMFRNEFDRGRQFREVVRSLKPADFGVSE